MVSAAEGVLANDTDAQVDPLTAVLVSDVTHGSLTLNPDGVFTYTPAANFHGTDTFTYRANDGFQDSAVTTVTITVDSVNDAPVAADQSVGTDEDVPLTGTVSAADADADALTYGLVGDAAHGSVTLNPDGGFTYTPAANFHGTDTFTFRANDGTADGTVATVTITVNSVNDAPVAADQTVGTAEDTALNGAVTATDVEGDPLTYALVADAAHGTVTLSPDGSFTYTPAANYNGPDSFTFQANDGTADSNVATVTITVTAVNDAPVLTGTAVLDGIAQGNFDPAGQTVSSLFGPLVGDLDGDALAGIAVVGNTADPVAQGAWQYSTDGVNWFDVGPVSESAALASRPTRPSASSRRSGSPATRPRWSSGRSTPPTSPGRSPPGQPGSSPTRRPPAGQAPSRRSPPPSRAQSSSPKATWLSAATGNLYVTGTTGNETIVVRPATGGRVLVVRNGVVTDTFTRSRVTGRISLYGLDGNDRLVVSPLLANPADLYGGAGNDILYGGSRADRLFGEGGNDRLYGRAGNDVLVGGDGNDILGGGAGNDVLIGGNGKDLLQGSLGSDLLIGGTTAYDLDPAALSAIAAEWGRGLPASYADRIAHLGGAAGGLNGTTVLTAGTVSDDGVGDVLGGYYGLDWFWTGDLDLFAKGATEIRSVD